MEAIQEHVEPAETQEPTTEKKVASKLVYLQAPVQLGRLVAPEGEGWRVSFAGQERVLMADESVDPALLSEAAERGVRVVIECAEGDPLIVGLLQASRTLEVDREGHLIAELRSVSLTAKELLFRGPGAFIEVKDHSVELYANKVLTRARTLAKTLAAMIKFN